MEEISGKGYFEFEVRRRRSVRRGVFYFYSSIFIVMVIIDWRLGFCGVADIRDGI